MKAKFTTYLELDLQGMTPVELNQLAKEVNERLSEVRKANDALVFDVFTNVRAEQIINRYAEKYLFLPESRDRKPLLSDISGQQISLVTGGRKTIEEINKVLITNGFDPVY